MQKAVECLNLIVSFASALAAILAVRRPSLLPGTNLVTPTTRFYLSMYVARSIPFGCLSGLLPFFSGATPVGWLMFTAAAIQALDALIAARRKLVGMVAGASVATIVHTFLGLLLLHRG